MESNIIVGEKKEKLEKALASFLDCHWHFPEAEKQLKGFVLSILTRKISRIKHRVIICSNIRENLLALSAGLLSLFSIESAVSNGRFNWVGARHFQLAIQKKQSIEKLKKILEKERD
ncbi:MAG: hypothetical protein JW744_02550 [Candidatus Diapherotrites archaeon]|uniref:Uncharacterized protein n=1 Tax=Candidatus Iainarchaeum sp. TaxID=3101447 RepID=A0A939C6D5_9ARCH|nr:hypothetical protein [Candidatus Diapherotrites archaeon]